MSYHATVHHNKDLRRLLTDAGISLSQFTLASFETVRAGLKHHVKIQGRKVTVYGPGFIATGFIKP